VDGKQYPVWANQKPSTQGAVSMQKKLSYRILQTGLKLGLGIALCTGAARAQQYSRTTPTPADMSCSGLITDQPVPTDAYLISGEESRLKSTFSDQDFIYINQGSEHGVKVGDRFDVIRPITDLMEQTRWFKYQPMLTKAMGTRFADIGRLRVIHVDAKTSTAQIDVGCDLMERGDIVLPSAARPVPQFHEAKLDLFAPASGKKTGMVVTAKDFSVLTGPGTIIYVNLGSSQGVRIGDYFRVFRYQGSRIDSLYQTKDMAFKLYGYGSTPAEYQWDNLPRQILGEGIVLRTGPNTSTVLLTNVRQDTYIGDYVELE
jgi:hypothetical protein